jgi:hypothetical protein
LSVTKEREMTVGSLIIRLALMGAVLSGLEGCQSVGNKLVHHSVAAKEPEVLVRPLRPCYERPRLAIYYFFSPPYAAGAVDVLTTAYSQELVRSGLFRQVAVVRQVTPENMDVLDISRADIRDFDLVLRAKIVYLLAGTGASTTELAVEVQMVDVSPQMLRWYVKQRAVSEPGPDIDLIWGTIEGKPAVPYRVLAEALAKQFTRIITPSDKESQDIPVKSPSKDGK